MKDKITEKLLKAKEEFHHEGEKGNCNNRVGISDFYCGFYGTKTLCQKCEMKHELILAKLSQHEETKKKIMNIINKFGREWMIALEMDDGEFEHVEAKEHSFFIHLKDAISGGNGK